MIPKIIHYCWFGRGEKPRLVQKCMDSWRRFCPDYEIMEWNEDNFPIADYPYAQYCLETKKWAFLSDFVRLSVTRRYGGIYFDTDVELIRSPDGLLEYQAFYGFETDSYVATGLGFGTEKNHPVITAMEQLYLQKKPKEDGTYEMIGCPRLNTAVLVSFGLQLNGQRQQIAGAEILPADYMNPYNDHTGKLRKTENTVSIHWYGKSALDKKSILRSRLTRPFHRIFGEDCFRWMKK